MRVVVLLFPPGVLEKVWNEEWFGDAVDSLKASSPVAMSKYKTTDDARFSELSESDVTNLRGVITVCRDVQVSAFAKKWKTFVRSLCQLIVEPEPTDVVATFVHEPTQTLLLASEKFCGFKNAFNTFLDFATSRAIQARGGGGPRHRTLEPPRARPRAIKRKRQ